jgi:prepilin-type N-terminal cleavage/methylation domain-containing protein
MSRSRTSSRSGFTLVELSIVLVVIGLIIGSILVAVNILDNARITSTVNTLQSLQSAYSTYHQNYGAVPGDDPGAAARFPSGTGHNGGGNGLVGVDDGTASFAAPTSTTAGNGDGAYESLLVWSDLRAAGLIKGDPTDISQPSNSFGGIFGIQNSAFSAAGSIAVGTNVLCINNVPGKSAIIIDQRLDDGNPRTGTMRGGVAVDGATATTYVPDSTYVVCLSL